MTNIVELKNLTVNYKPNKEVDKQLIHGIDINFRKGHITGVVGESGSGKSILMRSIMSIFLIKIISLTLMERKLRRAKSYQSL